MPLPKSLTQPFRQGMLTVGSGWRGYFAPFNQQYAVAQTNTALGPSIYDLEVFGKLLDPGTYPLQSGSNTGVNIPGWFDLGWIKKFKYTPSSKVGTVRSGYRGAVRAI